MRRAVGDYVSAQRLANMVLHGDPTFDPKLKSTAITPSRAGSVQRTGVDHRVVWILFSRCVERRGRECSCCGRRNRRPQQPAARRRNATAPAGQPTAKAAVSVADK